MLIVIDVMGTGEVEIDTAKAKLEAKAKKKKLAKFRPLVTDLPQLKIVVIVPTHHR